MKSPHLVNFNWHFVNLSKLSRILEDIQLILAEISRDLPILAESLRLKRWNSLTKSRWQKEHVTCHFSHVIVHLWGRKSNNPEHRNVLARALRTKATGESTGTFLMKGRTSTMKKLERCATHFHWPCRYLIGHLSRLHVQSANMAKTQTKINQDKI